MGKEILRENITKTGGITVKYLVIKTITVITTEIYEVNTNEGDEGAIIATSYSKPVSVKTERTIDMSPIPKINN